MASELNLVLEGKAELCSRFRGDGYISWGIYGAFSEHCEALKFTWSRQSPPPSLHRAWHTQQGRRFQHTKASEHAMWHLSHLPRIVTRPHSYKSFVGTWLKACHPADWAKQTGHARHPEGLRKTTHNPPGVDRHKMRRVCNVTWGTC